MPASRKSDSKNVEMASDDEGTGNSTFDQDTSLGRVQEDSDKESDVFEDATEEEEQGEDEEEEVDDNQPEVVRKSSRKNTSMTESDHNDSAASSQTSQKPRSKRKVVKLDPKASTKPKPASKKSGKTTKQLAKITAGTSKDTESTNKTYGEMILETLFSTKLPRKGISYQSLVKTMMGKYERQFIRYAVKRALMDCLESGKIVRVSGTSGANGCFKLAIKLKNKPEITKSKTISEKKDDKIKSSKILKTRKDLKSDIKSKSRLSLSKVKATTTKRAKKNDNSSKIKKSPKPAEKASNKTKTPEKTKTRALKGKSKNKTPIKSPAKSKKSGSIKKSGTKEKMVKMVKAKSRK